MAVLVNPSEKILEEIKNFNFDFYQLYDVPDSLVWTNIPGKEYGQSKYIQDLDYRQWNI